MAILSTMATKVRTRSGVASQDASCGCEENWRDELADQRVAGVERGQRLGGWRGRRFGAGRTRLGGLFRRQRLAAIDEIGDRADQRDEDGERDPDAGAAAFFGGGSPSAGRAQIEIVRGRRLQVDIVQVSHDSPLPEGGPRGRRFDRQEHDCVTDAEAQEEGADARVRWA